MLSRVILAVDWLNQLLSAYDIAQLLNILNFDVAVDDDFSTFDLLSLCMFDFTGVYFLTHLAYAEQFVTPAWL